MLYSKSGRVNIKTVVTIFARCFRRITKLSVDIDDKFFAELLNQELETLFIKYVNFLKNREARWAISNVAQYGQALAGQLKSIRNLLNILGYLRFKEPIPYLLLERDLLLVESFIWDDCQLQEADKTKQRSLVQKIKKEQPKFSSALDHLGHVHRQVAQFIASRDRVQNNEIFGKFPEIAKRTLKRKLKELIEVNVIKRIANGKRVFYFVDIDSDV